MKKMIVPSVICSRVTVIVITLALMLGSFSAVQAVTYMRCPEDYMEAIPSYKLYGILCSGSVQDDGTVTENTPWRINYRNVDSDRVKYTFVDVHCFAFEPLGFADRTPCFIAQTNDEVPKTGIPTVDRPVNKCSSIVHADHMSVGEPVEIVGTPFSLVYFSDRVQGRAADYMVQYPEVGVFNPPTFYPQGTPGIKSESDPELTVGTMTRTEVMIHGSAMTTEVPASATLQYKTFTWNGKDANGTLMPGSVPVTIHSKDIVCDPVESINCKEYFVSEHTVLLGAWQARVVGLGGWGISAHHFYDAIRKKVYLGFGCGREADAMPIQLSASGAVIKIDPAVEAPTHYLVTSEDGTEAYVFDLTGRHLETRSTTSGKAVLTLELFLNKKEPSSTAQHRHQ